MEELAADIGNKMAGMVNDADDKGPRGVIGFSGELALSGISKKAQQRLKKKMKKEEEE